MKVITGNQSPKAGEKTYYELTDALFGFNPSLFFKEEGKYTWTLYKKDKNKFIKIANNKKYGKKVPYTFGEKVVGIPFKIIVHQETKNLFNQAESKLVATYIVTPKTSKEPVIGRVILLNRGKSNVNKAKFNETLTAQARTTNLLGKEITFYLWEEGASEADKYKKPKKGRVNKDGIAEVQFSLMEYASQNTLLSFFSTSKATKNFFVTAVYEKKKATNKGAVQASDETMPDIQPNKPVTPVNQPVSQPNKPTEPTSDQPIQKQTDVEAEGLEKPSEVPVPQNQTPASVDPLPVEKSKDGKCPRCEKLTKQEVDQIFTTASEKDKNKLVEVFNEANNKFEINTCRRKAHFFAQVLAEVSTALKLTEPESFNYSVRRLKGGDYVSGSNWVKGSKNPKEGGYYSSGTAANYKKSPFSYFLNNPKDAEAVGRKDLNSYNDKGMQAANSEAIANFVYADKNRGPRYKLGNVNVGDGWKFMGKGIIQVTGRENYTAVNKRLERKGYNFDIVNNPNALLQHKESILSAMAFWYWKDLQLKSDTGGKEIVDSITIIVNEGTDTYVKRKEFFDKTYLIFQVDKCSPVEKATAPSNGKWRFPIDNPMLCLYSQGGGAKPWHGSFGQNIRDGKANHSGSDLLAAPGTTVYAGLKGKIARRYTSTSLAGRVIVVEVTDKETFKSLKNDYKPLYKSKGELSEKGFNHNGTIYFVFMHLSKFGDFKDGDPVNHDSIIGYTGISGNNGKNFETRNPHLHFEVNNVGSAAGIASKCNPQVYFKFKTEADMTAADKELQLKYKNKLWK